MFRLDGKTALVTGAATGLGAGIAEALAVGGADVALVGRPGGTPLDGTEARATGHGTRIVRVTMDVCDLDDIRRGARLAEELLGRIDILVNNAGINRPAPGVDVLPEWWDDQFQTNVRGGFFLAQALAPKMIARGWGRIIWISSQAGVVGIPNQSVYCATKGAVNQLVRTLGLEWAESGVTVNAVCPTFVETALTRERLARPDFRAYVMGKLPGRKLAQVEDVAAAVVYLASEEAGMVNCHTLMVDGGWTAW